MGGQSGVDVGILVESIPLLSLSLSYILGPQRSWSSALDAQFAHVKARLKVVIQQRDERCQRPRHDEERNITVMCLCSQYERERERERERDGQCMITKLYTVSYR